MGVWFNFELKPRPSWTFISAAKRELTAGFEGFDSPEIKGIAGHQEFRIPATPTYTHATEEQIQGAAQAPRENLRNTSHSLPRCARSARTPMPEERILGRSLNRLVSSQTERLPMTWVPHLRKARRTSASVPGFPILMAQPPTASIWVDAKNGSNGCVAYQSSDCACCPEVCAPIRA